MSRLKSIVFDLGGVIMTLDQSQAVRRFEEIGVVDAAARLDPYAQSGFFGDLEEGKISADDFRRMVSDVAGHEISAEQCAYAWQGYAVDVPRRNLDFLIDLRREGRRVSLLSNTNPFMMQWAMSEKFSDDGHSLDYYFDAMYLSYREQLMKPGEAIFLRMLQGENALPNEVLFIDDSPRNVATARSLGIHTMQPENGTDWTGDLRKLIDEIEK